MVAQICPILTTQNHLMQVYLCMERLGDIQSMVDTLRSPAQVL